ncbi:hypothetical protein V1264_017306 [Littorina saxatilis]|uniref:Uncharacterized protein n=1 Tax=Littorina saxatilis TaxID=31220 RepID=A0AAN9BJD4_9CAEN
MSDAESDNNDERNVDDTSEESVVGSDSDDESGESAAEDSGGETESDGGDAGGVAPVAGVWLYQQATQELGLCLQQQQQDTYEIVSTVLCHF